MSSSLLFRLRVPGARISRPRAAFTLIEVVIALGVLGMMAGGAFVGFNTINAYAVSSRLYSEAHAVAQNQIDQILSRGPFHIGRNQIPSVLQLGTAVKPNVFVYRDSVTGNVLVTGSMITTISEYPASMPYAGKTRDLNIRKATVTVNYAWRNRTYDVTMETLRTADE
jgi:prepilin-type N-terminal cleavage/methylation domain-containing protein